MPKCPACHRDTVTGLRADGTAIALDPSTHTYVFLDDDGPAPNPSEGKRIAYSLALVIHEAVCRVRLREEDKMRAQKRAVYEQQKGVRHG